MRRIMASPPTTSDADAIVQRSRAVSGRLSRGVIGLLKKNKVQTMSDGAWMHERG
jgi:pyruvate/2-oxoglutarate dehydrogenase complex dihydrolipoamide dehydrogenase (E3) component